MKITKDQQSAFVRDHLERFDYTGPIGEVMARFSIEQLTFFARALDCGECVASMYFMIRRAAVELGTPGQLKIETEQIPKLLNIAETLLTMARLERLGEIIVTWPAAPPFVDFDAVIAVTATPIGMARHLQLERMKHGRN